MTTDPTDPTAPTIREINGRDWAVYKLPPTKSIPILYKITQIGRGVVGPLVAAGGLAGGLEGGATRELVSDLLNGFFEAIQLHLPADEFLDLCKKLVEGGLVNRKNDEGKFAAVTLDQDFGGDGLVDLFLVIPFVLEVNYARFFSEMLSKLLAVAPKSLLQSPPTPSPSPDSPPT